MRRVPAPRRLGFALHVPLSIAAPAVQDLLEDLAHARPHELAALRIRIAVAAAVTRRFAWIEIVVGHPRIVDAAAARVKAIR